MASLWWIPVGSLRDLACVRAGAAEHWRNRCSACSAVADALRDRDKDRDRDKLSHPLVDKLIRHIQGKKDMPRFKARLIAMDLADRRCLGCRGQMSRGVCADRCSKVDIHADLLAKMPAEIAKLR